MKKCSKCGESKPATSEYFYIRKDAKCGLRSICKECSSEKGKQYRAGIGKQYREVNREKEAERHRKYREANRGKIIAIQSKWREANREKDSERKRKWCEANREKISIRGKKYREDNKDKEAKRRNRYYEANKERYSEYQRQWSNANRDIKNSLNQRRKARKRKLPATLTPEQWESTKQHFGNKCAYCGKELPLEQDHFMPLSKGGEYALSNIIPSCKSCNCSKQDKVFFEWYPTFKHYSKARETKILKYLNYTKGVQQLSLMC